MRKFRKFILGVALATGLVFSGCGDSTDLINNPAVAQVNNFTVFAATGGANVTQRVTDFQNALGGVNNGNGAAAATGFRRVNWDGGVVPLNVNTFPFNLFNDSAAGVPRGILVGAAGNGLRAANDDFAAINATYAAQFNPFSNTVTFSPTTTNILWAKFEPADVRGVPASTHGFGAVFADVDTAGSTSIEFFNGATSLGVFNVTPRSDATGHSFLGVTWQNGVRVTSVKLKLGSGTLAAGTGDVTDNAANPDLVVVDDFIYGEPQVVQ